jgi:hypothetical protein
MPFRVELPETFADRVAGLGDGEYLAGMWVCSGSPVAAEIAAASGMQWVLIDAEHSPIGLETTTSLLRAMNGYPATPVVRVPVNDTGAHQAVPRPRRAESARADGRYEIRRRGGCGGRPLSAERVCAGSVRPWPGPPGGMPWTGTWVVPRSSCP